MSGFPSGSTLRRCLTGVASLALLGALGCVTHGPGGTTLYVFDQTSMKIYVWADVNSVYGAASTAGGTVAAPDRTIVSTLYTGRLAWGGLTVDANADKLYLVNESGTVTVVNRASTQNGSLSNATDTYQFTLGTSTQPYANAAFGQASVDSSSNTLFVLETSFDGRNTRIWQVPSASQQGSGAVIDATLNVPLQVSGNTYGVGVAAMNGGNVYGLFGGGNTIYDTSSNAYGGPRIQLSQSGNFTAYGNIIIDQTTTSNTGLSGSMTYGGLAYDNLNSALYVVAQASAPTSVLVFNKSQFTLPPWNQKPARTLADSAVNVQNLRTLSHPPSSDWLLGANLTAGTTSSSSTGTGTPTLLIWKSPSGGGSAATAAMPGINEIRGMAIGGNTGS